MRHGRTISISTRYLLPKNRYSPVSGRITVVVGGQFWAQVKSWLIPPATSFLLRNGFDMSKPLIEGVHYLSRQEADQMRQKLIQDEELRSKIPDMQLSGDDDHLVNHIVDLVGNWQSQPKKDQQSYLNIPAEDAKDPVPAVLNRYQVRLVHQIIRNQYPGLKSQGMGQFVQITNPRSEAQVDEKADREKRRELEISNAIGLRWVWEAIMGGDISKLPHHYVVAGHTSDDCPKDIQAFLNSLQKNLRSQSRALVGHNCMTDLVNLYRCFIGDLPLTVGEFSAKLQELFPIVIDTKYIAGLGQNRHLDTSLQSVETDLAPNALPRIHLPSMFDKYLYSSVYHEAGFDSWVTAKIGLKLPLKLKRGGQDIKAMVRKTLPCSPEDDSVVEIERKNVSPSQEALSHEKPGTGIANSIVGIISNPVTVVKSLLTGVSQPVSERPAATTKPKSTLLPATVMPTTGAVVAAKEKAQTSTIEKDELKKLKDISKKSNIYDMLEDEPEDASIESAEKDEEERINELLKAGMLLPRWEKDAEFWKLISNKLQANATQEGILDLTRR